MITTHYQRIFYFGKDCRTAQQIAQQYKNNVYYIVHWDNDSGDCTSSDEVCGCSNCDVFGECHNYTIISLSSKNIRCNHANCTKPNDGIYVVKSVNDECDSVMTLTDHIANKYKEYFENYVKESADRLLIIREIGIGDSREYITDTINRGSPVLNTPLPHSLIVNLEVHDQFIRPVARVPLPPELWLMIADIVKIFLGDIRQYI